MKLKTVTTQSLEAAEHNRLFNVFETLLAVKKEVKSGRWALKWIDNKDLSIAERVAPLPVLRASPLEVSDGGLSCCSILA